MELWETSKVKFMVTDTSINNSGHQFEDKIQLNRDQASTVLQYLIHYTSYNPLKQTPSTHTNYMPI